MDEVVYKLKHIPTGLYYQPVKGRWAEDKTNLSTRGKIYTTYLYPKMDRAQSINISKTQAKKFISIVKESKYSNGLYIETIPQDWEVETYTLIRKI